MSESTPDTTATSASRTSFVRRTRPRKTTLRLWWLLSLLVHSVVCFALLWISPLREKVFAKRKDWRDQDLKLSSDRIEEIAEHILDVNETALRMHLQDMEWIHEELGTIRDEFQSKFDNLSGNQTEAAPDEVLQAFAEIHKAQADAQQAQARAEQALAVTGGLVQQAGTSGSADDRARAMTAQGQARGAQLAAQQAQTRAEQAMARAVQAISWTGFSEALAAQKKALEAQSIAKQSQTWAEQGQWEARDLLRRSGESIERVGKTSEQLKQAGAAVETARTEAAQTQQSYDKARATEQQSRADHQKARAEMRKKDNENRRAQSGLRSATQAHRRIDAAKQPDKAREAANAVKQARALSAQAEATHRQAVEAEKKASLQYNAARTAAGKARRASDAAKADLRRKESDLNRVAADLRRQQEQANRYKTAMLGKQPDIGSAQSGALKAQDEANRLQKEVERIFALALVESAEEQQVAQTDEPLNDATQRLEDMYQLDLPALYRRAVKAEDQITERYKEIRATELAMLRKMPLDQAMAATDMAKPVRPDIDEDLLRTRVRTGQALEEHKHAVKQTLQETGAMVDLAYTLLDLAQNLGLTRGGGDGGGFSLRLISEESELLSEMEAAAAESESVKAKDLTGLMRRRYGMGKPGADKRRAGVRMGGVRVVDRRKVHPQLTPETEHIIPGRKITSTGVPANWMYVDSWYLIGPWANPARRNIDKKFPPETVVSLDAKYVGKGGRVIRWEFVQSGHPKIEPPNDEPYGIWYAYSEVHCEKPCDLWVAIGSDDKSKIWINDLLVWESVPYHKAWHISEGYRKVHLCQGRNRILYRLENGHMLSGLSLVMCTMPKQ